MTVHGVPKPVWRAFALLHQFAGTHRLPVLVGAQPRPGNQSVQTKVVSAFATYSDGGGGGGAAADSGGDGGGSGQSHLFLSHWSNPEAPSNATSSRVVRVLVRHCNASATPSCALPSSLQLHLVSAAKGGCDPAATWRSMGSPPQPTPSQLQQLTQASEAQVVQARTRLVNETATEILCTLAPDTAAVLVLGASE